LLAAYSPAGAGAAPTLVRPRRLSSEILFVHRL
jgi:hypothetical protein